MYFAIHSKRGKFSIKNVSIPSSGFESYLILKNSQSQKVFFCLKKHWFSS